MPTYEITAQASGEAVVTVHAANEDEAEDIAYADELIGISIGSGSATWEITNVRETES
jgi:hypothetical protein